MAAQQLPTGEGGKGRAGQDRKLPTSLFLLYLCCTPSPWLSLPLHLFPFSPRLAAFWLSPAINPGLMHPDEHACASCGISKEFETLQDTCHEQKNIPCTASGQHEALRAHCVQSSQWCSESPAAQSWHCLCHSSQDRCSLVLGHTASGSTGAACALRPGQFHGNKTWLSIQGLCVAPSQVLLALGPLVPSGWAGSMVIGPGLAFRDCVSC
uniref:Uncharacterized protein n=1 Tax=Crocodylus porosus TaxID=8502 RepID=A0A7M4EKW6_CROPO